MGRWAGVRRSLFAALTVAGVVATPATAGALPPDGVGTVTCALSGKVVFGPALHAGGTETTTVKVVAKMSGCTGTADGAKMTGGKLVATGTMATTDCDTFFTNNLPVLHVKIKWKAGPPFRFNPSFRTFDSPNQQPIGTEDGFNFTQGGTGHVTDTGSFFTQPMSISVWPDPTVVDFYTACHSASGQRYFKFTGLNPNPSQLVVG